MNKEFWVNAWADGRTNFHQITANPWLQLGLSELKSTPKRALVPLCGKTIDLLTLAQKGIEVVGVEIAAQAVDEFFRENKLTPGISKEGAYSAYRVPGLTILSGDFFEIESWPDYNEGFDFIYDRAALIALPLELRTRYLKVIKSLITDQTRYLVDFISYDGPLDLGPPFSVSPDEIIEFFKDFRKIKKLKEDQRQAIHPRFIEAGVQVMQMHLWLI
jgi:thiopurine S-methyltransferase